MEQAVEERMGAHRLRPSSRRNSAPPPDPRLPHPSNTQEQGKFLFCFEYYENGEEIANNSSAREHGRRWRRRKVDKTVVTQRCELLGLGDAEAQLHVVHAAAQVRQRPAPQNVVDSRAVGGGGGCCRTRLRGCRPHRGVVRLPAWIHSQVPPNVLSGLTISLIALTFWISIPKSKCYQPLNQIGLRRVK